MSSGCRPLSVLVTTLSSENTRQFKSKWKALEASKQRHLESNHRGRSQERSRTYSTAAHPVTTKASVSSDAIGWPKFSHSKPADQQGGTVRKKGHAWATPTSKLGTSARQHCAESYAGIAQDRRPIWTAKNAIQQMHYFRRLHGTGTPLPRRDVHHSGQRSGMMAGVMTTKALSAGLCWCSKGHHRKDEDACHSMELCPKSRRARGGPSA